ncbi:ATP-binding protein [Kitasatospora sp. NPDC059571]|uniref:ATP-binding protein n=1 Tax=Kitasatospora sp. NPDC059571 TaxID=3346871 RepID=UPI0036B2AF36
MDDGAPQVRRLVLHGRPGSVSRCREFTRDALYDWGWLPAGDPAGRAAAEDVLLMVAELAANAMMHAGGLRELVLLHSGGGLRVELLDASPQPPAIRTDRRRGLPGGYGLLVVDRLARAWGSRPVPGGKAVWAEVAPPPGGSPRL